MVEKLCKTINIIKIKTKMNKLSILALLLSISAILAQKPIPCTRFVKLKKK